MLHSTSWLPGLNRQHPPPPPAAPRPLIMLPLAAAVCSSFSPLDRIFFISTESQRPSALVSSPSCLIVAQSPEKMGPVRGEKKKRREKEVQAVLLRGEPAGSDISKGLRSRSVALSSLLFVWVNTHAAQLSLRLDCKVRQDDRPGLFQRMATCLDCLV